MKNRTAQTLEAIVGTAVLLGALLSLQHGNTTRGITGRILQIGKVS
jgi:hypothetical protein